MNNNVHIGFIAGIGGMDISDVGGSLDEDTRRNEGDEELEVAIPIPGVSIQDTDFSIPVQDVSIPVPPIPVPGISKSTPQSSDTTRPTSWSDSMRPLPVRTIVTHCLPPYITDHPLISKTAYETAV